MTYSKLVDFARSSEMISFRSAMQRLSGFVKLNHTMVGFNFSADGILSTKFYYVFSGLPSVERFPFPELADEYAGLLHSASAYHLETMLVPGAGLTFALKFDPQGRTSRCFFMRVTQDNSLLVENLLQLYPELALSAASFDEGYGQYVVAKAGIISKSEYVYLHPSNRFDSWRGMYGVNFSAVNWIEIAAAGSDEISKHKFIAMGFKDSILPNFLQQVPNEIMVAFEGMDHQLCCPAIAPVIGQYSIYILGNLAHGHFDTSPIDYLLARSDL